MEVCGDDMKSGGISEHMAHDHCARRNLTANMNALMSPDVYVLVGYDVGVIRVMMMW